MPFNIVEKDIVSMPVDAVVNAANADLLMGGGVCGAIFKAAGPRQLQSACNRLSPIKTGQAVITPGFELPAKYIIHAVGPVYDFRSKQQCKILLRSAYIKSLELARANNCASIAFPLISSGIYGYPKDEALEVAVKAISDFLKVFDMDVYLVIFNRGTFHINRDLLHNVSRYLEDNLEGAKRFRQDYDMLSAVDSSEDIEPCLSETKSNAAPFADDFVPNLDAPFSELLGKIIDRKGKTDVEVYKRANLDRKHFSKIRKGGGYTPRKTTVLALAVALELSLAETSALLERAGYAISHASKFDVIVEYFIKNGNYSIHEINQVLFKFDQPLLGGSISEE